MLESAIQRHHLLLHRVQQLEDEREHGKKMIGAWMEENKAGAASKLTRLLM
jgi:hypothetical protein